MFHFFMCICFSLEKREGELQPCLSGVVIEKKDSNAEGAQGERI